MPARALDAGRRVAQDVALTEVVEDRLERAGDRGRAEEPGLLVELAAGALGGLREDLLAVAAAACGEQPRTR